MKMKIFDIVCIFFTGTFALSIICVISSMFAFVLLALMFICCRCEWHMELVEYSVISFLCSLVTLAIVGVVVETFSLEYIPKSDRIVLPRQRRRSISRRVKPQSNEAVKQVKIVEIKTGWPNEE